MRIVAIVIVGVLAACGGKKAPKSAAAPENRAAPATTGAPAPDKNDDADEAGGGTMKGDPCDGGETKKK